MKLYSVDVRVVATAYIKADSKEDAIQKARSLHGDCLEVEPGDECEIEISGLAFDDPDLPEISLSPTMTVWEHYPDSLGEAL